MTSVFRIFGNSAEGVSYAIIFTNLLVPLIERVTVPVGFGRGSKKKSMNKIIKNALILAAITLIAGLFVGAAHQVTLETSVQKQQERKTGILPECIPGSSFL